MSARARRRSVWWRRSGRSVPRPRRNRWPSASRAGTGSGLPAWPGDDPDHLLYLSNASGKFEVYAWDRTADRRWQVTDRPEGTGYRVPSRLDPSGRHIWWFDDAKGNELGRWVREPFAGA